MRAECYPIKDFGLCPPIISINRGKSEDAQTIQKSLEEIWENLCTSESLGAPLRKILNSLAEIKEKCSIDNWDGYGAKAIDIRSFKEAERFIRALLPYEIPIPEANVDPDGEISFEWYEGPNRLFTISIGANGMFNYAGLFGNITKIHGAEYFGDALPKTILEYIQKVFS